MKIAWEKKKKEGVADEKTEKNGKNKQ